jgi:hemerythrin superfamily protein
LNETPDALTLLRDDHRAMADLFTQIDAIPSSLPADDEAMQRRRTLFEQVSMSLTRHAMAEEELLYPMVRRELPDGDALADQALDEHQVVKETLARLEKMSPDNLDFDVELRSLTVNVREHVTEEEGTLFERLAQHVDAQTLDELGRQLENAERAAPTRPHPNAPNRPPFNVVAGVAAAVVDRTRDAVTGRGE